MEIKDAIDSVRQQIGERLNSPIFGSFAIAWLIWNHQYLLVIFSSGEVQQRLELARKIAFPTDDALWWRGLYWPAITTAAYILIYPWLSFVFLLYWDWRQTATNNRRVTAQGKAVMTEDARVSLLNRVATERTKFKMREDDLEKQIAELRVLKTPATSEELSGYQERIRLLEEEVAKARGENKGVKALDRLAVGTQRKIVELLKLLSSSKESDNNREFIGRNLKVSDGVVRAILGHASAAELIKSVYADKVTYTITPEGVEYLALKEGSLASPSASP